jgi:hypothetical protein
VTNGPLLYTMSSNTATTSNLIWSTPIINYEARPSVSFPSLRVENALESEEQWLRRRVAEVCAAVAA